jgi:hypothetical protein
VAAPYITLDDPDGTNGTWAYGVAQNGEIVGQFIDNTNSLRSFEFTIQNGYVSVQFGDNATQVFGVAAVTGAAFEALVGNYTDSSNKSYAFMSSFRHTEHVANIRTHREDARRLGILKARIRRTLRNRRD